MSEPSLGQAVDARNGAVLDDRLRFRPRARIIRTIGDQLISGPEAAVIELVKNAYDADATEVSITFTPPLLLGAGRITVADNGHGMTLADIQEKWMEPATSSKAANRLSAGRQRIMMGSKGIGRFAAAKLGERLVVRSVSERAGDRREIMVGEIDWSDFSGDTYLEDVAIDYLSQPSRADLGTEIEIRGLTEQWPREKIERLLLELRRLISPLDDRRDDQFRILLDLTACTPTNSGFEGRTLVTGSSAAEAELGASDDPREVRPFPLLTSSDYEVTGVFDQTGRFSGTMQVRRGGQPPEPIELSVPKLDEEEDCGPVRVRFFIFDREAEAVRANLEKAGMGRLAATAARAIIDNVTGVAVYRDGFRVRPYGSREHDWLTLDTRRVNSPTLRIGHNQIAGYVTVEGQESGLQEKSSREGFEDNAAYRRLRRMILALLAERVEPRRLAFREKTGLSRRPTETTFDEVRQLSELRRLRRFAASLPQDERDEAEQIIDREAASLAGRIADLEERHRILEARSSLGAIIAEVIHEGVNEVSYLITESRRLQGLWHTIHQNQSGREAAVQEFPRRLAYMHDSSQKLSGLFDALQPLSGGRRTKPPISFFPTEPIARSRELFGSHGIPIRLHDAAQAPKVLGYPDDLATAVTNLFKNALHWLAVSQTVDPAIDIRFSKTFDKVRIDIDDNGPGIPREFLDRVFDPGFSLRDGGTGLGLNIAREALKRSGAVLGHDLQFEAGTRFTIILDRDRPE